MYNYIVYQSMPFNICQLPVFAPPRSNSWRYMVLSDAMIAATFIHHRLYTPAQGGAMLLEAPEEVYPSCLMA